MVTKIYNILSTLALPLGHLERPKFDSKKMVISYHLFNERPLKYKDGKPAIYGGSLQIDLFVKHMTDYTDVQKQIRDLLISKSFFYVDADTSLENVEGIGRVDHIVMKFNYKESEDN